MKSAPNQSPRGSVRAHTKAFTLVELLVVIGIIAVLIAILLPALGRARAQAQTVACLANLRSIGQAIGIYAINNKGSLPYGYWDGQTAPGGNQNLTASFFNNGGTLATDWALLLMSNALGRGGDTASNQTTDTTKLQDMFICPAASDSQMGTGTLTTRKLHYSAHPRLMPSLSDMVPNGDGASGPTPAAALTPYKLSAIQRSSEIILIFDGAQFFKACDGNALPIARDIDQEGLFRDDFTQGRKWNFLIAASNMDLSVAIFTPNADYPTPGGQNAPADIRWRHGRNDTANFLYVDGHADSIRLKKNVNADLKLRNLYVNAR